MVQGLVEATLWKKGVFLTLFRDKVHHGREDMAQEHEAADHTTSTVETVVGTTYLNTWAYGMHFIVYL